MLSWASSLLEYYTPGDVQGMQALHDKSRCFLDLKPTNIMVSNWDDLDTLSCTIIDLGGSVNISKCEPLPPISLASASVCAWSTCPALCHGTDSHCFAEHTFVNN